MILTVTPNPLLDFVLLSPRIPQPGGKRLDKLPFTVGGKGINVARMLKTLGRPALALTFAGGANGIKIVKALQDQGISFDLVETLSETRAGINLVVEEPNYHTWWIENGEDLQKFEVDKMLEKIGALKAGSSFIALSGTIPGRRNDDFYLKVLEECRDFRGEIYLDARGAPLKAACKAGGFFLKHNRDEAIETFALDPFADADQSAFFRLLEKMRIWGAMITNGKGDVLLWDNDKIRRLKPAPAKEVSAVGCGDAALAGFLYGRAQGLSLFESAAWGLAAGAADAEHSGPCEATFSEVEEKLKLLDFFSFEHY
ncbi:MAG: 1-phosphofructokinase [Candidatus Rifleibacteriota bacterium]